MGRILPLLLLAAACVTGEREPASTEPLPTGEPDANGTTVVGRVSPAGELRADTLQGAHPDTAKVERETVLTGVVVSGPDPERAPAAASAELATGWRVQVFASRERDDAESFAQGIEERMQGRPVYVEWAEPWYKVRIGDFPDRESAEALRSRLVELGFDDAWTVRTTIRTVP